MKKVPIQKKSCLTLEEAAEYIGIDWEVEE